MVEGTEQRREEVKRRTGERRRREEKVKRKLGIFNLEFFLSKIS